MIFFCIFANYKIGVWRSWLAHLHGVQGVESSSLFTPTFFNNSQVITYFIPQKFPNYPDISLKFRLVYKKLQDENI